MSQFTSQWSVTGHMTYELMSQFTSQWSFLTGQMTYELMSQFTSQWSVTGHMTYQLVSQFTSQWSFYVVKWPMSWWVSSLHSGLFNWSNDRWVDESVHFAVVRNWSNDLWVDESVQFAVVFLTGPMTYELSQFTSQWSVTGQMTYELVSQFTVVLNWSNDLSWWVSSLHSGLFNWSNDLWVGESVHFTVVFLTGQMTYELVRQFTSQWSF